jgi:hypothetical protein
MSTVTVKVGDTSRALTDTLLLNGSAINLTGATVTMLWQPRGGPITEKSVDLVVAASGTISYTLVAADVVAPTEVHFAWKITFSDSTVLIVPTINNHILKIAPQL